MPGAKVRLLAYLKSHVGKPISKEKLAKIANAFDWARVLRNLRQEGWSLQLIEKGKNRGCYILNSLKKEQGNMREAINQKIRYRILLRDNSTCQRCGIGVKDGAKMMIDHKVPVDLGGETVDDNLWTLCNNCNLGKKHWFKDIDLKIMKEIFNEKSGYQRMKKYFEACPNELLEIANLDLVSGIRDWERTARLIRSKEKMNIKHIRKDPKTGKEGYIYRKD